MKEIFKQYAAYNVWANQKIVEVILNLPEEQQQQTVESSFPSLQKTLQHIWDAEAIWWQRIKLSERIEIPGSVPGRSIQETSAGLLQQDKEWYEWVAAATEFALEHVFAYRNSKKEEFKQPVYQVLLQLFNHATYHRRQLVTILRQLKVENIPGTDFIIWSRNPKLAKGS